MTIAKTILYCFFVAIIFISCGEDDSACTQADWAGTYDLVGDPECEFASMASVVFNDEIVITTGATETTINWDGSEESFTDCSASDGIVQITLDGDKITSRIGECMKEYNRR